MENIDPNIKQVNGPINVVRLEGTVDNIKKVIYVFMDMHVDMQDQTECDNIFSSDIQTYLAKNFYKLNGQDTMYDFFFEVQPYQLQRNSDINQQKFIVETNRRMIYIQEVYKFFKKMFTFDPTKNKVMISDVLKNVRLHYIDIREFFYMSFYYKLDELTNISIQYMRDITIWPRSLDYMSQILESFKQYCELVSDILGDKTINKKAKKVQIINIPSENQPQDMRDMPSREEHLRYMINKITNVYNNPHTKKILNKMLDKTRSDLKLMMTEVDDTINLFKEYGNIIRFSTDKLIKQSEKSSLPFNYGVSSSTIREMINKIVDITWGIFNKFVDMYVIIMDIYFLRRFLDKSYITHAITYTGGAHSNNYIHILVKWFGFKITHVSYSKITDLNKLTDVVRKKKSSMSLMELLYPPISQQCSDMTNFPPDFK